MTVEDQLKTYADMVDERLALLLPSQTGRPPELVAAMRYSCLSPGKRLRPALCLAACEAVNGDVADALNLAASLEMIHSFSLIHDDLPAIDNDDLRRGRATCHVKFGEAIAILAGDGLFSLAFETASSAVDAIPAQRHLRCIQLLSGSTGMDGLVSGEAVDILSEGKPVELELLQYIHSHKTGALIRAACEIGAVIGTEDEGHVEALRNYGSSIGLAFQIADDVLDETGTKEQLGKTAGADREKQKATYPRLMGIEKSRELAERLVCSATDGLNRLPGPTDFLRDLAQFTVSRTR